MFHSKRLLLCVWLIMSIGGLPGCALQNPFAGAWDQIAQMTDPDPNGRRNLAEDVNEEWAFVGDEGRRDRETTNLHDNWYRDYVMSDKAKAIEANLGVE